jgi:hypothetical protein
MLWLYDSRDRLHGKRKLHILPLTPEGKLKAWDIVLDAEVMSDERDDYQCLVNVDAEGQDVQDCDILNDYWGEYGWYLMPVEPDAEVPHDAEVTPESIDTNEESEVKQ